MDSGKPVISAFNWVPDLAKGRVRDLRVRWAFEEVGQPYDTVLFNAGQPRGEDYLHWQPFDQVPALRDGNVEMFESGAILLRIAEKSGKLLPEDEQSRWQAISWLIAALNTIDPVLGMLSWVAFFNADKDWSANAAKDTRPFASQRLQRVSDALDGKDWLASEFSIADIGMVTAFLNADETLVDEIPRLAAYRDRAMARPAYKRALDAQLADFT